MKVETPNIKEMISICAGFVREGLTFEVYKHIVRNVWVIELTGGY